MDYDKFYVLIPKIPIKKCRNAVWAEKCNNFQLIFP